MNRVLIPKSRKRSGKLWRAIPMPDWSNATPTRIDDWIIKLKP